MGLVVGARALHIQRKTQGHDAAPEFPEPEPVTSTHQATAYAG